MTPTTKALARYLHGKTKRHWAPFDLPYQSKYAKLLFFHYQLSVSVCVTVVSFIQNSLVYIYIWPNSACMVGPNRV